MLYKKFLIYLGSIVCALGLNGITEAKSPRDIAKQVFPSVVMLVMEDDNGQPLSLGSGFFINPDLVATNLHVVEGAAGGYAKIVGKKQKYDIAGYLAIDHKMDLVLLKINNVKAPVITYDDSSKIEVGDEIYAVGNPRGLEGTFSKGIISAIRKIEEDTLFQITAPISPGSSGGPILNSEGKVIGVSVATFKGGQNLNFAIPSSYLASLLFDIKPVKALPVKEKPKKKVKSILADMGGRNTEGVVGKKLIWTYKYNQSGHYSFTLENKLREPVRDIWCLVVFYDSNKEPIDIDFVKYSGVIPGRLAKRVKSRVEGSVQELTTMEGDASPFTRIEFRILHFQFVEQDEDIF